MIEAIAISDIVKNTPTELRGVLLKEVGNDLIKNSQGYTGKLFREIGEKYDNGL